MNHSWLISLFGRGVQSELRRKHIQTDAGHIWAWCSSCDDEYVHESGLQRLREIHDVSLGVVVGVVSVSHPCWGNTSHSGCGCVAFSVAHLAKYCANTLANRAGLRISSRNCALGVSRCAPGLLRSCGSKKLFLGPHVEFNFRLFRICFFSWCFFLLLRSRLPPESLPCLRNRFTVRPCTLASFFFFFHATVCSRMRSWGCVRWTLRLRSQPPAPVRSRPQLPAAVRNSLREVVMEGKGDMIFSYTVFWWLSPVVFSDLQHTISL